NQIPFTTCAISSKVDSTSFSLSCTLNPATRCEDGNSARCDDGELREWGDDDVHVETVWHFGGKMIDSPNSPNYVGGRAVEVDILPRGFAYSRLEKFS
ncbi:hypothetical protein LINGRAHAP2_LOCUS10301, partial [Linum grandiflorum]